MSFSARVSAPSPLSSSGKSFVAPGHSSMKSYSQHGEDVRIKELMTRSYQPFVVDVGANDGYSWSNSIAFIELGYSALLIEPMGKYAQQCRDRFRENERVFVEETAILRSHRHGEVLHQP